MKKIILLSLMTILLIPAARSQVLIALLFGDKLNTPNIEFGLNVVAFVERQPTIKFLRFSRQTIRKLRIAVETGTMLVSPRPLTILPGGDHPTLAVFTPARCVR